MRDASLSLYGFACFLACVFVLGSAGAARGQVQTGEIHGRVTDTSDAAVPGVTVTLTGPVLLQPLTAVTSETGTYQFPRLAVGQYSLTFELPGFKTVVREGIRVELGFNAQVNIRLEVSAVEETVTVTGESPVVDTRETKTGGTFNLEALQNIPSARDPWVILQQTAGIAVDRENIGGNQSGQQSGYVSRGSTDNTNWNLDGMVITSAVTGATPIYFDFDMFEEMQVLTGGMDAAQQTGGVGIHLVTKSGTDRFKGSARYYWVDDSLQANNVDDALRAQGAGSGNPVQSAIDYGFEAGGPLVRGRAWVWGSYGKQDIKVGILNFFRPGTTELQTDLTVLKTYNIKAQVSPFTNNKVTWHSNFNDKIRNARDASDLRPLETTYRQTGPIWSHKFSDQHIFTDRWLMEVQVAHIAGALFLHFNEPGLEEVQRSLELVAPAGRYGRSFGSSIADRPQTNVDLTTNYFRPGTFGGDHTFKAGFRYRDTPATSITHIGGNTTARFRNGVAAEAELHRDGGTSHGLITYSAYLQDTFTRGRLTANLGVRVDRQDDEALPSSVAPHPYVPQFLPAVTFDGADSGVVWTDWSPRLGVIYDLSGTGKTVAKTSFARYYGQSNPGATASILNPVTAASIRFPWADTNGDQFVQAGELDTSRILAFSGNYNPANPSFLGTPNTVDPNLRNNTTDEFIVGMDHELIPNFAVGASYIWRRYDHFEWDDRVGLTSADYVPVEFTATGCPSDCPTVTYYQPTIPIPAARTRTNVPDRTRTFNGLELTARKRLSNRWQMNASLALNDARDHWHSPAAYEDPTNIEQWNDAQFAPESSGSGVGNVFTNSRWMAKVSGMYSLPWDVNFAAFFNARQGYPLPHAIQSPSRPNAAGRVDVLTAPLGDIRLENFANLDLRVEKVITLMRNTRVSLAVDVFNALNSNTPLAMIRQLNASNALDVSGIVPPRIARLGVRVNW